MEGEFGTGKSILCSTVLYGLFEEGVVDYLFPSFVADKCEAMVRSLVVSFRIFQQLQSL